MRGHIACKHTFFLLPGFFDFYIIPLAKKLKDCGVFEVSSDEYLNSANAIARSGKNGKFRHCIRRLVAMKSVSMVQL